jgi:hypothetical protein
MILKQLKYINLKKNNFLKILLKLKNSNAERCNSVSSLRVSGAYGRDGGSKIFMQHRKQKRGGRDDAKASYKLSTN